MPSLREVRLRHAAHYANVLRAAEHQFNQDGVDHLGVLQYFDESAAQVRSAQAWLTAQTDAHDVDVLRVRYAVDGSGIIGIRYSIPDRIALGELGLVAARRTDNPLLQAMVVIDLANAYVNASDYERSVTLNQWCIETLEGALGASAEDQHAWLRAAYDVVWLGQYPVDDSAYNIARYLQGKAIGNIANSQFARGDLAAAETTYQRQLDLCRAIRDLRGLIAALMNLGALYVSQADVQKVGHDPATGRERYDQAIAACSEARALTQQLRDRLTEARTMVILGMAMVGRGSAHEAEPILRDAAAVLHEYRDHEGECAVLDKLGSAYLHMERYAQAEEQYAGALEIADREQFVLAQCEIRYHFGLLYQLQHRFGDAVVYYRQGLGIAEDIGHRVMEAMIQYNLSLIYARQGKPQHALAARARYAALMGEQGEDAS